MQKIPIIPEIGLWISWLMFEGGRVFWRGESVNMCVREGGGGCTVRIIYARHHISLHATPQSKWQSTFINIRVPQCLSARPNWDSPTLSSTSVCVPPPGTKGGGGDTLACLWGVGAGGKSQFRRLEKKPSTLSTLWSKPESMKYKYDITYTFLWYSPHSATSSMSQGLTKDCRCSLSWCIRGWWDWANF